MNSSGSKETPLFTVTRAERRRRKRRLEQLRKFRYVKVLGILTGLSLTSALGSHLVRGTHALFTDQTSQPITVRTITYFPQTLNDEASHLEEWAEQARQCEVNAQSWLAKVQGCKTSEEAQQWLELAQNALSQAGGYKTSAASAYQALMQWISIDNTELNNNNLWNENSASGSLNSRMFVSTTPSFALDSLNSGQQALNQTTQSVTNIQTMVQQMEDAIKSLQASEEAASLAAESSTGDSPTLQSGDTSGPSSETTTGSVYGQ